MPSQPSADEMFRAYHLAKAQAEWEAKYSQYGGGEGGSDYDAVSIEDAMRAGMSSSTIDRRSLDQIRADRQGRSREELFKEWAPVTYADGRPVRSREEEVA